MLPPPLCFERKVYLPKFAKCKLFLDSLSQLRIFSVCKCAAAQKQVDSMEGKQLLSFSWSSWWSCLFFERMLFKNHLHRLQKVTLLQCFKVKKVVKWWYRPPLNVNTGTKSSEEVCAYVCLKINMGFLWDLFSQIASKREEAFFSLKTKHTRNPFTLVSFSPQLGSRTLIGLPFSST